jgi:hypothetical protein
MDLAKSFYDVEEQKKGMVLYNKKGDLLLEELPKEKLVNLIEKIEVSPKNKTYIVYYTNGLKGVCKPNHFSLMNYEE